MRRSVSQQRQIVKLLNIYTLQEFQVSGALSEVVYRLKKPRQFSKVIAPYSDHFKSKKELHLFFKPLIQDLVDKGILEIVRNKRIIF